MFEHKNQKISPHITQITDPTGVFLFLVEGEKEAVLVDTGVGFAGLKETVDSLTSLPLSVILTHMHPDHAGGAGAFEKVYVHPKDLPMAEQMNLQGRMRFGSGAIHGTRLTPEDFIPAPVDKAFLPLSDGQVFDLGGISLEIIHVPGHTPGSCCVLFREERSVLFGDACNANTLILWGCSISQYKEGLQHLQTYRSRFDTVYYSHGLVPEGPGVSLEDNLELCDRILAGTDEKIPDSFIGIPCLRAAAMKDYVRLDGGYGNIVYTENARK